VGWWLLQCALRALSDSVRERGASLARYQDSTTALEIKNRDMKQRMDGMQKAAAALRTVNHDLTAHLAQVNSLVADMSNAIQDPKALKEAAKVCLPRRVSLAVSATVSPSLCLQLRLPRCISRCLSLNRLSL
jgi:septal ring factor EnvC (AmiA/AmiB activator)